MNQDNKTQDVMNALLQGRTINQLDHGREFRTTRLGGIVHLIKKKGLKIESVPIKDGYKYLNPPVEYYCTVQSIGEFCDKKSIPVPNKFYRYFDKLNENQYICK